MKVKKFLKGLMAAALAVTMAVTPVSAVKAAEVTVTSGASTYTFSQEPVAAFEVTGLNTNPFIAYCVLDGTQIHSQAGSSEWQAAVISNYDLAEGIITKYNRWGSDLESDWETSDYSCGVKESQQGYMHSSSCWDFYCVSGTGKDGNLPAVSLLQIYHADVPEVDEMYVIVIEGESDIAVIQEAFAYTGVNAVQIPVADALAMDNANVQLDTANTQTADAQTQADAQAAQQAAEAAQAQAQADALAAQQAADAAAQAQITAQQTNTVVSQGTYTVEANDNLCKIAQKVYGDMKAWREIYKANPTIKSDYVIYKGQVLVIPAR